MNYSYGCAKKVFLIQEKVGETLEEGDAIMKDGRRQMFAPRMFCLRLCPSWVGSGKMNL